jgi:glycine/D-amino acid oxidase-like deaminating enzyme
VSAPLAPGYRESCYWLEGVDVPRGSQDPPPGEADAVVVGGGFTGIAAAWELARRGRSVVVLEKHSLGWGASTRNGGMVLPDVKHSGAEDLRRRLGDAGPAFYRATLESVRALEALLAEHDVDCDYERSGHVELAHCPSAMGSLRTLQRVYRDDLGIEGTIVPSGDLSAEIGSTAFAGGLAVESSGGLQPAKLFAGLARLALDAGAVARENTPAIGIERADAGFDVRTPRGSVRCGDVLLATDGYTDGLVPRLQRRIMPVGSYLIATEPIDPGLAKEISPKGRMFFDTRNFLSYWRLSPDGSRVLFGGRASFAPTTVARARDSLYRRMLEVHPQLAGVGVEYAWGGMVGLTRDRIPRLGRTRDGVTYALGYSGTGVAASSLFGIAAAGWMSGDEKPAFAGPPFPSIPLSWARSAWLPVVGLWFKWKHRC